MRIIRSNELQFIPASHEDPNNPGVLKKVLFVLGDFTGRQIQMINWAKLPVSKSFQAHYHEDMEEVFVMICGNVEMNCGDISFNLSAGDGVLIPAQEIHSMHNIGEIDAEYFVVGVSHGTGGKTVNVHK